MVSEIVFRQTLGLLENTPSPSRVAAHAERRHKEAESILFYFLFCFSVPGDQSLLKDFFFLNRAIM